MDSTPTGWLRIRPFDPVPAVCWQWFLSLGVVFLSTPGAHYTEASQQSGGEARQPDLHIGLLAEHELTKVPRMLHSVRKKLGIESKHADESADLEIETKPEDALAEIARRHRSGRNDRSPGRL